MKRSSGIFLCTFLLARTVTAAGHPFTELEIPLPTLTGTHARAVGMGGAQIAVAEDASAMTWNPAGLARVRRIELEATLSADGEKIETTWFGSNADATQDETQFAGLHFLYPFPTYRGSLVFGFGMDRLKNFNLEYKRSGMDGDVALFDGPALLTDTQTRTGKLTAWSAGVGWDVTPRLAAGITVSYLKGTILDEQDFLTEDVTGIDTTYISVRDNFLLDLDLSGYSALGGVLYQASPRVRLGAVAGTPRVVDFGRFEQVQTQDFLENGTEEFSSESNILVDETITFPWFVGFGASWSARGLLIAGDVRYTDWSNLKDELGDFELFLKPYYGEATSVSAGGEYLFSRIPLRLRGGYGYDPVPFNLTYCPFDECLSDGRDPAEIDVAVDRNRHVFSAGAGYLFGGVFALDVAFETARFERVIESDPALYSETRSTNRIIATSAYRF